MKKRWTRWVAVALALALAALAGCSAQTQTGQGQDVGELEIGSQSVGEDGFPSAPTTKADGSKFRIAFVDLDPYDYTTQIIYHLLEGLKSDGWLEYDELPDPDESDARALITYLAENGAGPYIEFVADASYYTLIDGEDVARAGLDQHIRVNHDIDMLWACSTSTAKLASEYADEVIVIAYPLSAPVTSGIVKGEEYSEVDNVWAHVDTSRFRRQMKVFREVYPFQKIGAVYYDEGVSSISDYIAGAEEEGVEIVCQQIPASTSEEDIEQFNSNFLSAVRKMLRQDGIDAFLLTADMIKSDDVLDQLLDLFNAAGVPVFVQSGDNFVEDGCLLTVQILDPSDVGRFVANAIGKMFNGAKPSEVRQVYISTPYLILNMDSVKRLGIVPPFEMLISCEKIYSSSN